MAATDASPPRIDLEEVHRAIGAVVAAAARLEWSLTGAVASLTRSPLTSIIVQGERGTTLVRMADRLLRRGIGSTEADYDSGRTERLGLISHVDTTDYLALLKRIEKLFGQRDAVAHSLWLANLGPGKIQAQRTTRAATSIRQWTLEELERLRQDFMNAEDDLFVCSWNTSGSGMERIPPRQGDALA